MTTKYIYELASRINPALTDLLVTCKADGSETAGKTSLSELKAALLLDNVDNTADSAKPLSTAMTTALAGKSDTSHTHSFASLTTKPTTIAGYGITDAFTKTTADTLYKAIGYVPAWSEVTGKPAFATVATSGLYSDLTGKPTLFTKTDADALYKAIGYVPAWAEITSKPTTFAPSAHTHTVADITATGTRDATTILYGDGTWKTAPAGGGGGDLTKAQADTYYKAIGYVPTWSEITSKPATFTPSAHTHLWVDITDKPATFAPSAHTHIKSEITDFAHTHLWADITDKPATFTPSAHTHTKSQITDFAHTHLKADITDFAHTHPATDIITSASNRFVTDTQISTWDGKQAALVSGTNIKTVNGQTLLGAGDLVVSGGSSSLSTLSDVVITTPANMQYLRYNSATSKWVNDTMYTGTSAQVVLGDGSYVTRFSGTATQYYKGDGTLGTFNTDVDSRIGAAVLDSLSDTAVAGAATADKLHYNGTSWTNLAGRILTGVRYLTSGTAYTPTAGTTAISVKMVGGGGGGGGVTGAASSYGVAGGGGAGAFIEAHITGVSSSTTYTYAIGAGGTAGANTGGTGGTGGTTSLTVNSVTYSAAGGAGGVGSTTGTTTLIVAGGAGGAATITGTPPATMYSTSGEPGSPAYRISGTAGFSGNGGSSEIGGGGQAAVTANVGANGSGYGAGGGGALSSANQAKTGGAGSGGAIIIYEYA